MRTCGKKEQKMFERSGDPRLSFECHGSPASCGLGASSAAQVALLAALAAHRVGVDPERGHAGGFLDFGALRMRGQAPLHRLAHSDLPRCAVCV